MKKVIAMVLAVALMLCTLGLGYVVNANESCQIYVTIVNKEQLVVTQKAVNVTDVDGDTLLTVNDALYIAHENYYDGGAQAGYGYYTGDYELSMSALWGDKSGSFGYYKNNNSCMSLADTVADGDYVTAFVYASSTWSDVYSYFDVNQMECGVKDEISLTLLSSGYDAAWNPITVPVANATITVNGTKTNYITDSEGKVTIKLDKVGTNIISATSESSVLVPPVCMVVATSDTNTSDMSIMAVVATLCVLIGVVMKNRKVYEK